MVQTFDIQFSQTLFELGSALPRGVVVFLAVYLLWAMVAAIVVWSRTAGKRALWALALSGASAAAAYGVNAVIGFFVALHERPFVELGFSPLITAGHFDKAFPSDHSAIAFALAASVFARNKKTGAIFCIGALLVALGRALAGVHYVSDVVAGAVVGIAVALVVRAFSSQFAAHA